jgi:uncharacterized DUF497 family protein
MSQARDQSRKAWSRFIRARLVFDGRPAIEIPDRHEGEARFLTVAVIDGKFVTVVWTWRGDNRRLISFRRSRHAEEKIWRRLFDA